MVKVNMVFFLIFFFNFFLSEINDKKILFQKISEAKGDIDYFKSEDKDNISLFVDGRNHLREEGYFLNHSKVSNKYSSNSFSELISLGSIFSHVRILESE